MLRKHGVESHVREWYESNKIATLKYQLLLRTSNLPGLVSTGKMIANEGGAVTCKFIFITGII